MTTPVDVLEIMGRDGEEADACRIYHDGVDEAVARVCELESKEARAAVVELIAAAKLAREMRWLGDNKPERSLVYLALTAALVRIGAA